MPLVGNKFSYASVWLGGVKKKRPSVGEKWSSVWLGGQDVAEEGRWVWTSAGNQPLAQDLMWASGKVYAF